MGLDRGLAGGAAKRKVVLTPRAGSPEDGKKRTSVSVVPVTMMFFRNGSFYQTYNATAKQFEKEARNPCKHNQLVFSALDGNDRLGTEVSPLNTDAAFGVPISMTLAVLLLEFACSPNHALVLQGQSKTVAHANKRMSVIENAAKELFVETFSYSNGYGSFAAIQTKFLLAWGLKHSNPKESITFNHYVVPEQQAAYHELPTNMCEKAHMLLPHDALKPIIMNAVGKTPNSIRRNIGMLYKGVCMLNFSFFLCTIKRLE